MNRNQPSRRNTLQRNVGMTELEFRLNPAFRRSHKNKQNKKKVPMKIIKHLKFAGLAAMLLLQPSITRADDNEGDNRDHRNATITWTKYVPAFLPPGGDI